VPGKQKKRKKKDVAVVRNEVQSAMSQEDDITLETPDWPQSRQDPKTPAGAVLSGGDLDAAWDQPDSGEETVGGSNPTPDQDVVEEIGQALGLTYEDEEPVLPEEKLRKRDRERWELHPASSEDFGTRSQLPIDDQERKQ
jgi:hypothetical protein